MINRQTLLSDLQKLLQRLETDLFERSESPEVPDVAVALKAEYERAKAAERTAQNYEDGRSDAITQAAAVWVLSCVFVRFLEDNRLIDPPKISGPAERLQRARDEHELYFREHLKQSDRDYLLAVFDQLASLPGTKDVFGEHNPIRELPNWLSGDAAGELLRFFQKIDANTGNLVHEFADANWDTRFLGDLYQDLSEAARKKYALLQTPEFVEEFILDQTLNPALDEFGLEAHAKAQRREEEKTSAPSSLSAFAPLRESLFKMIDPACGSGHFLLGSFRRILDRWEKQEPGTNVRELAQRTLDSVHGVDVNPYAVAIARFRLLLAAMRACGIERLADAPAFRLNLVCGDSLLHAPLSGGQQVLDFELAEESDECDHAYRSENLPELKRLLRGGQYHAVVANPPYITPKDRQLNERYRRRFLSCHMKYSLSVPFLERIFRVAVAGGYTGQITANSFMKREFGKKLIETFFPSVDLTHVIDTSGAYIPGHGTPTVILFGRNRPPVAGTLRTVMGIRGEPSTPADPARGLVWSAILELIDTPGGLTQRRKGAKKEENGTPLSAFAPLREMSSHDQFVSVSDSPRELFHKHPWSIGGGGASELKELLEERAVKKLDTLVDCIGFGAILGEDEAFGDPVGSPRMRGLLRSNRRPVVEGDQVRDWTLGWRTEVLFPYDEAITLVPESLVRKWLWPLRTCLWERNDFSKSSYRNAGRAYWEYHQIPVERNRTPLSIVFGEVATHNHFVLDRGGKVFKQTAPVIKLPREASEDDHLALLGLLNSSTACFWMKQVCFPKGGDHVGQEGARVRRTMWDERFAFNGTNLAKFPLPLGRPLLMARLLDQLAQRLADCAPVQSLTQRRKGAKQDGEQETLCAFAPLRELMTSARQHAELIRGQLIALQEELDWECYRLYGLLSDQQSAVSSQPEKEAESCSLTADRLPRLQLGQRAFEIVLARKMAAGETQTTWFERHGSTPITELPAEWPDDYRRLVQRRIDLIESDPNIRLIEQPEYKRRWNTEPWDSQLERALREWLLDRLESYFDFDGRMKDLTQRREGAKEDKNSSDLCASAPLREISLVSVAKLADVVRQDAEFQQVGELYRDDTGFDVQTLVSELVASESVPLLPALRYKESGLRKRKEWENTWELQREEDRLTQRREDAKKNGEDLSAFAPLREIPVPPKYTSADFISTGGARYWSLRGKLDVPKERWISFPHCEGPDGTPVIAWAGYDHLQQARAISAYYVDIQERLGGRDDPRLIPLLACLLELLPWLKQWHNEVDPEYGMAMGDYFEGFVNEEARQLGKTIPEIKAWTPPKKVTGRGRKKAGT